MTPQRSKNRASIRSSKSSRYSFKSSRANFADNFQQTEIKMTTKLNYKFPILMTVAIAVIAIALSVHAADLSDNEKQFLAGYEKIHIALAAVDLDTAKSAASELGCRRIGSRPASKSRIHMPARRWLPAEKSKSKPSRVRPGATG